jgi:hypothetical protein
MPNWSQYLDEFRRVSRGPIGGGGSPEAQLVPLITRLLEGLAPEVRVVQEFRTGLGRPDMAVYHRELLVGFVELKAPGKGADPECFADPHDKRQWKNFRHLPNLVYTDGESFALYHEGSLVRREVLRSPEDGARVEELLLHFLYWNPVVPKNPKELARFLAPLTRFLREAVDRGLVGAVLEVSSHALALKRVEGLAFGVGVFVNFYPDDHLDFHGTPEAYFQAKALLVERSALSVLNTGLPHLEALRARPHLLFGPGGEVFGEGLREEAEGLRFTLHTPWGRGEAFLPLLGGYNLENALAASAAALAFGLPLERVLSRLATFPGVPGRMEVVWERPFRVVIDFAHTGKSLEAALLTLRRTTQGRLLLVVGAAGERDPRRREDIGRVAARLADKAFFTEEDHRTEPLEAILEALAEAARREGGVFALVPDREEAILRAILEAEEGDTVLLAGKGHETTLERGREALPWDERAVALSALRKRFPEAGPRGGEA